LLFIYLFNIDRIEKLEKGNTDLPRTAYRVSVYRIGYYVPAKGKYREEGKEKR